MANRKSTWTNQDNLYVGFGRRNVETNTGAGVRSTTATQTLTMKITGADLSDAVAAADLENAAVIPAGALLKSATLFVNTQFAGASATLDIGTYNADANDAADDDGIDAAIATAALTAGAVITCDGADVGTVCDGTDGWKISASYDTAAFTAGEATLVIEYLIEQS